MRDRKERVYGCGMAVKSLQSTPLAEIGFRYGEKQHGSKNETSQNGQS